jgi:CheY-like chemotaxis protein
MARFAPSLIGARALVVDDEQDARDLVRFILEAQGAKVTTVGSAGAALYTFGREWFDVLIADIGMPEQDGYSLIRALRSLPESRGGQVPAIAVTAYASLRERDQAIVAGFDYHLSKPVEPEELVTTVASAVAVKIADPPEEAPDAESRGFQLNRKTARRFGISRDRSSGSSDGSSSE